MIDPIDECVYEVNDILALIAKGSKWVGLANRMTKLLVQTWNDEQKNALRDVIRYLAAGKQNNDISKEEFNIVVQELEDKLGARMSEVFRRDIQKIQLESYTKGHIEIGIDFEFNTVDKKALRWLFEKDVKQFWIGDSYSSDLNKELNSIAAKVLKAGLGRDEAGKLFKGLLSNKFEKTNNYWEMLSEHIVTRSREFGRTSAYEKAGIDFIKIVAVMDNRTSAICRFLNGKIIPVSKAIDQRNKLMKAKTVEAIKKIAPWYSDKKVSAFASKYSGDEVPAGVGLPPYHGFCRTTTVIAYQDEFNKAPADLVTPSISF